MSRRGAAGRFGIGERAHLVRFERRGRWQGRPGLIDARMAAPALDRVAGVGPFGLGPHQVGQPRAVDELVDHPRRHQRRLRGDRRGGEGEGELFSHLQLEFPHPGLSDIWEAARDEALKYPNIC